MYVYYNLIDTETQAFFSYQIKYMSRSQNLILLLVRQNLHSFTPFNEMVKRKAIYITLPFRKNHLAHTIFKLLKDRQ